MDVENRTPLVTERTALLDKEGHETLLVVIKGTYASPRHGQLSVAEEQVPIHMVDAYYGAPGTSSIKYESDLAFIKKGTDVVLNGHAYVPRARTTAVDATLHVGPVVHTIRVFGDRVWERTLGLYHRSAPAPFEKMPLTYERSFGGVDASNPDPQKHGGEPRNPVGVGYRAKHTKQVEGTRLPNLENPRCLIRRWSDTPEPVGFGFISREWAPRRQYAGTYDATWLKTRSPLLPVDFNDLYFQGAHSALTCHGFLAGNEQVNGQCLSVAGSFNFQLPGLTPQVVVTIGNRRETPVARFDTLIIEPDLNRVVLVWRATVNVHSRLHQVKSIRVS